MRQLRQSDFVLWYEDIKLLKGRTRGKKITTILAIYILPLARQSVFQPVDMDTVVAYAHRRKRLHSVAKSQPST